MSSSVSSPHHKYFTVLLFLLSLIISFLLGELTIRFLKRDIAYQPDPTTIRSLKPDTTMRIFSYDTLENTTGLSKNLPEHPVLIGLSSTNNLGLHMSEPILAKKPEEKRVLLLGDSFTEAQNVKEQDRFFKLAEELLNTKSSNWKIINAGIQNGSPAQYALQLQKFIPLLKPDYVVIATGANDLMDDTSFERQFGFNYDKNHLPISLKSTLGLKILKASYLLRYLDVSLGRYSPKIYNALRPPANPTIERFYWVKLYCSSNKEFQNTFDKFTGKHLININRYLASNGIKSGILIINYNYIFPEPFYEPRFPGLESELALMGCKRNMFSPYNGFMEHFCTENKLVCKDTIESFKKAHLKTPNQNLWGFWDYHFTTFGHKVAARDLVSLIQKLEK